MGAHFRATHYMIFSFSAFALFILISYYATNNSLQSPMSLKNAKHAPWIEQRKTEIEVKSANLGRLEMMFSCDRNV